MAPPAPSRKVGAIAHRSSAGANVSVVILGLVPRIYDGGGLSPWKSALVPP